ncbi:MAG: hypothetical protein AB8H03_26585 [Saprospiraceae bacterium]
MLLRNTTILLALIMCLALNVYAQNYYFESDGKTPITISAEKILVKFKSNLNQQELLQILSKQRNYLNLEGIQKNDSSRFSILELKNILSEDAVNVLLGELQKEELVSYVSCFFTHPDGRLDGITNRIWLKLKSTDQLSLLDRVIYDFQGVTMYTRSESDPLLFEIKVHKNRNALALANEIQEYGIFDYCEPDFIQVTKQLTSNDSPVNNQVSLQNKKNNIIKY